VRPHGRPLTEGLAGDQREGGVGVAQGGQGLRRMVGEGPLLWARRERVKPAEYHRHVFPL
jgi:hypothetical protein